MSNVLSSKHLISGLNIDTYIFPGEKKHEKRMAEFVIFPYVKKHRLQNKYNF